MLKGLGKGIRGGRISELKGTWVSREVGLILAEDIKENLWRLLDPNLGHEDAAADIIESHRSVHTKESQIRCNWPKCGSILSAGSFVLHWRTHTGENRFPYHKCGEGSPTKASLKSVRCTDDGSSRHKPIRREYSLRSNTKGAPARSEALASNLIFTRSMAEDDGWQAGETEETCSQYSVDSDSHVTEGDPSEAALLRNPTDSFQILGVQEDAYPPHLINQLMESGSHGYKEIKQIMGSYKYVEIPFNAYSMLAAKALQPNDFVENVRCCCEEDCLNNCPNISMLHECDETNCSHNHCSNRCISDLEKSGIQRGIEIFDSGDCGKGLRTQSGKTFKKGAVVDEYVGFVVTEAELAHKIEDTYQYMDVKVPRFRPLTLAYIYIVFLCRRDS